MSMFPFPPHIQAQVDQAMMVLGPRYYIRYQGAVMGRYYLEVIEGNNETIYRIDAQTPEQMCSKLLRSVIEDKLLAPAQAKGAEHYIVDVTPVTVASGVATTTNTWNTSGTWLSSTSTLTNLWNQYITNTTEVSNDDT